MPKLYFLLPIFSLAMVVSTLNAGYVRPDIEEAFFEKELLTLDVDQQSELARKLAAVTRNFPKSAAESPAVRARAMTIALMLDPSNREAVTSNGMFANGLTVSKVEGFMSYKALVRDFERLARHLTGKDANVQDKRLGLMMADLIWRLDPESKVGEAYEEIMNRGEGMDWSKYISPEVDQNDESSEGSDDLVDPFSHLQDDEDMESDEGGNEGDDDPQSIFDQGGLDELRKPEDDLADEPEDDLADEPEDDVKPVETTSREKLVAGSKPRGRFTRVATLVSPPAMGYMSQLAYLDMQVVTTRTFREWSDGELKDMEKPIGAYQEFAPYPEGRNEFARSEVYRERCEDGLKNLRNDYEGWPKGCLAQVSCPRYGGVSGSLGSLATLVGVDALVRDLDIDPGVVVLGSFVPDSDRLSGHVELAPALLRLDDRLEESVKRVVVPTEEAELYCNMLAAVEPEIALKFQIFAVDSVREASELAVKSVEGPAGEAIEEFKKIQDLEMRFEKLMSNPHVQKKLTEIVEKCPQHLSARALLKACQMAPYGKATLSEKESVDLYATLIRPFAHMLEYDLDAISPSEAAAECDKFMLRLYKVRRNTARTVSGVGFTAGEFVKDLLDFVSRKNRSTNSAMQKFDDAEEKFKTFESHIRKFDVELKW